MTQPVSKSAAEVYESAAERLQDLQRSILCDLEREGPISAAHALTAMGLLEAAIQQFRLGHYWAMRKE